MANRKKDHLELAKQAQGSHSKSQMSSVYYEPLFTAHPLCHEQKEYNFLNHTLHMPFWISSMTGGDDSALKVNSDLARACENLGIGLGLGSCRVYVDEPQRRDDFHVRALMPKGCLATNLGIAQIEQYLNQGCWAEVEELLEKIESDFLFIHINPLQEWLQPEGDRFFRSPLETLRRLKEVYSGKLGVKEVGQGFGPQSLKALVSLGVDVIELAGSGGTNFTTLERMRTPLASESDLEKIGHHWSEMLVWLNELYRQSQNKPVSFFPEVIISGGIRTAVQAAQASIAADFPHLIGMGYTFLQWQRCGELELQQNIKKFYQDYLFTLNILKKNTRARS